MKYGIFILILLCSTSIFSQRVDDIKESFSLKICMSPSFIEKVNFTIEYNSYKNSCIEMKNSYFDNKHILDLNSIEVLKGFLESYNFDKTNNISTETVIKDGDTSIITIVGFDGISVSGTLTQLDRDKEFEFWSPQKNTDNYKLVKLLFSITDQYFVEEKERRYLNSLKGYFRDLTPSRLQDSSHIEFRIREDVYMIVEKMPSFVGGRDSLNMYLSRKVKTNPTLKSVTKEGKVFVEFLINEEGAVKNVSILKGLDENIDNECLKIVAEMPRWEAGEHYGEKVKVSYRIPIEIKKNE